MVHDQRDFIVLQKLLNHYLVQWVHTIHQHKKHQLVIEFYEHQENIDKVQDYKLIVEIDKLVFFENKVHILKDHF